MAITKTKTITLTLEVQEGDFTIIAPDTFTVKVGEAGSFPVAIQPLLGFNEAIKFSVTGWPVGTVVTWTPSDTLSAGGAGIQCHAAIPLNAPVGDSTLTITGVSQ